MSDFGAMISITKTENTSFSEQEFEGIVEVCKQIKANTALTSSLIEPYLFTVGKTQSLHSDDCREVNILLAEYWGNASDFEWHKKVEVKNLKEITTSLRTLLPENYKLNPGFEWW